MIIRLMGADFSTNNIGELTTWNISWRGDGYTYSGDLPKSVTKNEALNITVNVASGYTYDSVPITIKMGGTEVPTSAISRNADGTITINIASVTGKLDILIGEEEPVDNIAYYAINKNIYSDGKIIVGNGRIAITNYFETNGAELSVTASFANTAVAKRYYQADKSTMASGANTSVYGRVVFLISDGTAIAEDVYAGETITINGTKYTLQNDPEYSS